MANQNLQQLQQQFPHSGRVEWIGLRPARRAAVQPVDEVTALTGQGLDGDHYRSRGGSRQVTLLQFEHLAVVRRLLRLDDLDPALLRRNLVISGIPLAALKGWRFRVGGAVLEGTGFCHPCSRMEETLGTGGYNAMRGHGGINARVLQGGTLAVGSEVRAIKQAGEA